jgi:hypothetical protein
VKRKKREDAKTTKRRRPMTVQTEPTNATAFISEPIEYREGPIARAIERYTARIPSDVFLWGAGIAVLGSLALQIAGNIPGALPRVRSMTRLRVAARAPILANFVGQWAPTLLLFGLYNKLVKIAGSDRSESVLRIP